MTTPKPGTVAKPSAVDRPDSSRRRSMPENLISRMDYEPQAVTEIMRIVGHLLRRGERPPRTILVTSAEAREGKSTVAGMMAATAARYLKKRTILVDGDLRNPAVGRLMAMDDKPGLGEWLSGRSGSQPLDMRRATGLENLHVLTAGTKIARPADVLDADAVEALVAQCAKTYDLTFIDTSPIMPVADPLIFSAAVDATVIVIKVGVTQRQTAQRAIQLLHQAGGRVAGCVLNDVTSQLPSYYSSSYYAVTSP